MSLTIFVFLIILSLLVFVHELGHFLAAKKMGIKVEEFGFGLPPRLWGLKRGGTIYSLNWLPIGGFVRLLGENGDEKIKKTDQRAFVNKTRKQRATVVVAGVLMNFLLGWLVVSFIFYRGVMVPAEKVIVEQVIVGSPAERAGLKEKDKIGEIIIGGRLGERKKIDSSQQLIELTKSHLGQELILMVERSGAEEISEIAVRAREDHPPDQGPLGIVITDLEKKQFVWYKAPFFGLIQSMQISFNLLLTIAAIIWRLLTAAEVPKEIAGPVGILQVTNQAVRFGFDAVLQMLGLLSLNLAVANLLPIPALDGGRLLFIGIEAISGKRVKARWERRAHEIGMLILLLLLVMITINDIGRILTTTALGAKIRSVLP